MRKFIALALIFTYSSLISAPHVNQVFDSLSKRAVNLSIDDLKALQFGNNLRLIFSNDDIGMIISKRFIELGSFNYYNADNNQIKERLEIICEAKNEYLAYPNNSDSLVRKVFFSAKNKFIASSGAILNLKDFADSQIDTISRNEALQDSISHYKFLNYNAPNLEPSFWESVLEPLLIISSAGALVALLFSARSK